MKAVIKNKRGSLTAEASIGMAVFLMTVVSLIALLSGLYTASLLEECLLDASMNMRSQMALVNQGTGLNQVDDLVFRSLLKRQVVLAMEERADQRLFYATEKLIGSLDVSRATMEYGQDRMLLVASVQWPLTYLNDTPITIEGRLVCRKWSAFVDIGAVLKTEGIKEVYMANHPSVYHTNPQCRSLKNRDKRIVKLKDIESEFRECKFCVRERGK